MCPQLLPKPPTTSLVVVPGLSVCLVLASIIPAVVLQFILIKNASTWLTSSLSQKWWTAHTCTLTHPLWNFYSDCYSNHFLISRRLSEVFASLQGNSFPGHLRTNTILTAQASGLGTGPSHKPEKAQEVEGKPSHFSLLSCPRFPVHRYQCLQVECFSTFFYICLSL